MRFDFATAARILFGEGRSLEVSSLAAEMGRRVLVVTGSTPSRAEPMIEALAHAGLGPVVFCTQGEPTTGTAADGARLAREAGCDVVVGFGGGSAVDAAKAVAALLANGGEVEDYLEVIGHGRRLRLPSVPFVAVPTTAGTGAEVTSNAVLRSDRHRVKVSLRSPLMLPRAAVVDPLLTRSMPPEVTAATGGDALTQLVEAFVSNAASPMTDGICREGMARAARSLRRAFEDGSDGAAREDMSLASLLGGMALSNARLGAAHGFAGPIGGSFRAPHGAVCARLLPFVMEGNLAALRRRDPDSLSLRRFEEAARILTGRPDARPEDGVDWIHALCVSLKLPALRTYGIGDADVPSIVARTTQSSSTKGNPITLTEEELTTILTGAL
jgi:alcohol dehydrogenase class IV